MPPVPGRERLVTPSPLPLPPPPLQAASSPAGVILGALVGHGAATGLAVVGGQLLADKVGVSEKVGVLVEGRVEERGHGSPKSFFF